MGEDAEDCECDCVWDTTCTVCGEETEGRVRVDLRAYGLSGEDGVGIYNFPTEGVRDIESWDDMPVLHYLHLHCVGMYFDAMHAGLATRIRDLT